MDQRIRKLITMHKALRPIDDIDYRCEEKKKEDDLPALKVELIHQFDDSKDVIKKCKEGLISAASNNSKSIKRNRITKNKEKVMKRQMNCMDILSYKQPKSHTRTPGHCKEKEILKEKLNLF